ncbi:ABC-2 type transport system permease protein [Kytococcus aerolatus]|uniref:Transport permease protein n=1 Tax=Kytococcus aerolatus TaxID=592308 RepID=A0A212TBA3_9MICO|nr:ABC transporter permease [Kytococcus aerolatus]SNC63285.1 ABC-2 type transport system permease protein [Kytococcus aerolatus]
MNPTRTLATAGRVLRQLVGDPRTMVLLLGVPAGLLALLGWVYEFSGLYDRVGAVLLAIFPFTVMFVVTSVATLRERQSGTLERLLTTPLRRGELLAGYALAFGVMTVFQTAVTAAVAVLVGLSFAGPWWALLLVALTASSLGTALGLLASAFARTEFQAVQFMPAFVLPQVLLCGLIVPREALPRVLELVSTALPLSHAVEAVTVVRDQARMGADLAEPLAVLAGMALAALALATVTLPRRTP